MTLTPLISFEDAVTAANLNPDQKFAVYYADGRYANRAAVAARCPQAKLFGITVHGMTGKSIFACDCEPGDLTPAEAEMWVAEQLRLNVELICVYASLDTWLHQGLLSALAKYGHRIKRWVADFNNIPSIPSWADADQFADPGPVDRNIALATFFGYYPPVVRWASVEIQVSVPEGTTGTLNAALSLDADTGDWSVEGTDGTVVWSGPGGGIWRDEPLAWNAGPLGG